MKKQYIKPIAKVKLINGESLMAASSGENSIFVLHDKATGNETTLPVGKGDAVPAANRSTIWDEE